MGFIKKDPNEQQDEQDEALDCSEIQQNLLADDTNLRRTAARDIINCPAASAMLLDQLEVEQNMSVRQVILTSLTQIGDHEAVEGLVECLRSEDVSLRNEAIESMKMLPQEVAPIMHNLLEDKDPDVRIFAVNILESLCHPSVEGWLLDVISDDQHVNVCATAVDLLGEVGSATSLEPLKSLKERFPEEPYIQFAADLAIKRINGD